MSVEFHSPPLEVIYCYVPLHDDEVIYKAMDGRDQSYSGNYPTSFAQFYREQPASSIIIPIDLMTAWCFEMVDRPFVESEIVKMPVSDVVKAAFKLATFKETT